MSGSNISILNAAIYRHLVASSNKHAAKAFKSDVKASETVSRGSITEMFQLYATKRPAATQLKQGSDKEALSQPANKKSKVESSSAAFSSLSLSLSLSSSASSSSSEDRESVAKRPVNAFKAAAIQPVKVVTKVVAKKAAPPPSSSDSDSSDSNSSSSSSSSSSFSSDDMNKKVSPSAEVVDQSNRIMICALSTTPEGNTSGGSHSTTKSSSLSADSSKSATAKSVDTQTESLKPMDRDMEIRSLEDTIKIMNADLKVLLRKIEKLADERRALLKLPQDKRDGLMLKSIDDDLSDMRKERDRLATKIAKLKTEMRALKHPKEPADAPVPAQDFVPPTLNYFLRSLCERNGKSFPSRSDPVELILSPHLFGDLPCRGRNELLKEFWVKCDNLSETFGQTYASLGNIQPRPCMFTVQSSPGCGKTTILREIGRKTFKAIPNFAPNEKLLKMKFVPISFNGITPIQTEEKSLKYSDDIALVLFFPRLVHSLFACDVDFHLFLKSFHECYGIDYVPSRNKRGPDSALTCPDLMNELRVLKQKYYKDNTLVALVDEISKVDSQLEISKEHKKLAENLRSLIFSFCDFNANNLFNFSIFTTLGTTFIEDAIRSEPGRLVLSLGRLDMLSAADTEQLLLYFMKKRKITLFNYHSDLNTAIQRTAEVLQSITRGHPRSIDFFFRKLECTYRSRSFKELIDDCIKEVDFIPTNQWCIRAAVIGNYVTFKDVVPYSKFTFDQAIERGDLIGSNEIRDKYRPFVSEMMIMKYLHVNKSVLDDEIEVLGQIIDIRRSLKSEMFEQIVFRRERLLSLYRNYDIVHNHEQRMVQDVRKIFSKGIQSFSPQMLKIEDAFALKVDRGQELRIIFFNNVDKLDSMRADCGIFVSEDANNEAFDFIIRFPIVHDIDYNTTQRTEAISFSASAIPGSALALARGKDPSAQEFLEVFYQIKYGKYDSTSPAKLRIPNIVKCRDYCKSKAHYPNRFVFVMFGWNETNKNVVSSNLPENTVVYDNARVSEEVGPTFSSFVSSQVTTDIVFTHQNDCSP